MGNGMARDGIPMFTDTPFLWTSFIVFLFLALEVSGSRGDSFALDLFFYIFICTAVFSERGCYPPGCDYEPWRYAGF
jgi:hypothetical protein